jgi:hypothetical protein
MRRVRSTLILVAVVLGAAPAAAQQGDRFPGLDLDPRTAAQLRDMNTELRLAGGGLRVVNLYRLQALILYEARGHPTQQVAERLVREVYAPYTEFWDGYMGGEANFRRWAATRLLAGDHPIHERIRPLVALDLERLFNEGTAWIESTTGRRPQGTWYLAFGPGWTDMGGLGGTTMLADFTQMRADAEKIEFNLPHELAHQIHGPSVARQADPDAGSVLDRIVSEGFASYVSFVYGAGRLTPAQAIGYTETEWAWAIAHERELFAAAQPYLPSTERSDLNRFASRSEQLIEPGATAVAYFLGFRIVEAYVATHGADSWKEIFDLPVREVLLRSGYAPADYGRAR